MVISKRNAQKPIEYGPYFISEVTDICTTEKDLTDEKGNMKLYYLIMV